MRVTDNLQKISMREELYHMEESSDYVSVVFRKHEAAAALATAIKARARLPICRMQRRRKGGG